MGVVSDVALRIFPREEGGSSAVFAYPTKPQCCQLASKAATALQEKASQFSNLWFTEPLGTLVTWALPSVCARLGMLMLALVFIVLLPE